MFEGMRIWTMTNIVKQYSNQHSFRLNDGPFRHHTRFHQAIECFLRESEVSLRGDGRLRGKQKHPGFLALHVAVDDHSRMAFTQLLPDQMAETTIGFLHSAVEFFARYGIAVRALLTDNGSCYRSKRRYPSCLMRLLGSTA